MNMCLHRLVLRGDWTELKINVENVLLIKVFMSYCKQNYSMTVWNCFNEIFLDIDWTKRHIDWYSIRRYFQSIPHDVWSIKFSQKLVRRISSARTLTPNIIIKGLPFTLIEHKMLSKLDSGPEILNGHK